MLKSLFEGFITKYNLEGSAEAVLIKVENNESSVQFITDDRNVFGKVSSPSLELEDSEYPVFNTAQLRSLLSVLDGEIKSTPVKSTSGKLTGLKLMDDSTEVTFVLSDPKNIPDSSGLKGLPIFELKINVNQKWVTTFIKATNALSDAETFTVVSNNGKVQFVVGYSENVNTNRVHIDVPCDAVASIEPISFSTKYFKSIFTANKDMENGVLKISSAGLAHIAYANDKYTSDYYVAKKDRKD